MSPDHAVPAHSPDQALDELALEALEDLGPLLSNQQLVEDLQRLLLAAPRNLDGVRQAVSLVLRSQPPAWQRRYDPHRNRKYTCDDFVRFVQGPLPEGLETDVGTLRRLLKDYPEELVLFEQALARGPGGANNPHGTPMVRSEDGTFLERATTIPVNRDVVTVDPHPPLPAREGGNSVSYAIRRLTRERPDLLAKVKAGELSCNAAMIQAGLRRVRAPLQWLRHWWARASPLERETFLKEVLCEA